NCSTGLQQFVPVDPVAGRDSVPADVHSARRRRSVWLLFREPSLHPPPRAVTGGHPILLSGTMESPPCTAGSVASRRSAAWAYSIVSVASHLGVAVFPVAVRPKPRTWRTGCAHIPE